MSDKTDSQRRSPPFFQLHSLRKGTQGPFKEKGESESYCICEPCSGKPRCGRKGFVSVTLVEEFPCLFYQPLVLQTVS